MTREEHAAVVSTLLDDHACAIDPSTEVVEWCRDYWIKQEGRRSTMARICQALIEMRGQAVKW